MALARDSVSPPGSLADVPVGQVSLLPAVLEVPARLGGSPPTFFVWSAVPGTLSKCPGGLLRESQAKNDKAEVFSG